MKAPSPLPTRKRPFFFELLCVFGLVYFLIYALLFIAGFFYSGWVTDAINLYTPVSQYSKTGVMLFMGFSSVLFILAFSGIIVMLKMRKYGYYIFGVSSLILASFQLFRPGISFIGTGIIFGMLILFGLYFRRFR
ncbi:MAG: hypothetical protein ACOYM0_08015 [Bacteroidales bacterium]